MSQLVADKRLNQWQIKASAFIYFLVNHHKVIFLKNGSTGFALKPCSLCVPAEGYIVNCRIKA